MIRYAQIDQDGLCIAVSERPVPADHPTLIPLSSGEMPLGMIWDGDEWQAGEPIEPRRVTKADFQRLLTPSERYAINALRKEIAAIAPADYADPANALMLAAEDVLVSFEQPVEFIELDHPETSQGLSLLGYLDVFGLDSEDRIAAILAGIPPA